MRIYPVRTLGRNSGFTLVELFIVTLLLAIFLTFASVNWDVLSKKGEDTFLANYSDGLTDLHLPSLIDFFVKNRKIGCFIAVKPFYVFHIVSTDKNNHVKRIYPVSQSDLRINGGFFIFKYDILDYIKPGEELVNEPFSRLIERDELIAYNHNGFWASLDTYKDKQRLDEMVTNGIGSWEIWKKT